MDKNKYGAGTALVGALTALSPNVAEGALAIGPGEVEGFAEPLEGADVSLTTESDIVQGELIDTRGGINVLVFNKNDVPGGYLIYGLDSANPAIIDAGILEWGTFTNSCSMGEGNFMLIDYVGGNVIIAQAGNFEPATKIQELSISDPVTCSSTQLSGFTFIAITVQQADPSKDIFTLVLDAQGNIKEQKVYDLKTLFPASSGSIGDIIINNTSIAISGGKDVFTADIQVDQSGNSRLTPLNKGSSIYKSSTANHIAIDDSGFVYAHSGKLAQIPFIGGTPIILTPLNSNSAKKLAFNAETNSISFLDDPGSVQSIDIDNFAAENFYYPLPDNSGWTDIVGIPYVIDDNPPDPTPTPDPVDPTGTPEGDDDSSPTVTYTATPSPTEKPEYTPTPELETSTPITTPITWTPTPEATEEPEQTATPSANDPTPPSTVVSPESVNGGAEDGKGFKVSTQENGVPLVSLESENLNDLSFKFLLEYGQEGAFDVQTADGHIVHIELALAVDPGVVKEVTILLGDCVGCRSTGDIVNIQITFPEGLDKWKDGQYFEDNILVLPVTLNGDVVTPTPAGETTPPDQSTDIPNTATPAANHTETPTEQATATPISEIDDNGPGCACSTPEEGVGQTRGSFLASLLTFLGYLAFWRKRRNEK